MNKLATELYNSYYQTGAQLALQEAGLLKLSREDLTPKAPPAPSVEQAGSSAARSRPRPARPPKDNLVMQSSGELANRKYGPKNSLFMNQIIAPPTGIYYNQGDDPYSRK